MSRQVSSLFLAVFLASLPLSAQEQSSETKNESAGAAATTTASDSQPAAKESPLVKAAKTGKDSKKKSRISISDKDLKSTTGKLIESNTKPLPPITTAPAKSQPVQTAQQRQEARDKVQARVEKARREVADLEKELNRLEEEYYNEDDPSYRDEVIEARFNKTKQQLEKARQALSDARDAASSVQ